MTVFLSRGILVVLGHLDSRFHCAFRVHELVRRVEEENLLWPLNSQVKDSDLIMDDHLQQVLIDLVTFLSILVAYD